MASSSIIKATPLAPKTLLEDSWIVISGVRSPRIWVAITVTQLVTPLITTHEPQTLYLYRTPIDPFKGTLITTHEPPSKAETFQEFPHPASGTALLRLLTDVCRVSDTGALNSWSTWRVGGGVISTITPTTIPFRVLTSLFTTHLLSPPTLQAGLGGI